MRTDCRLFIPVLAFIISSPLSSPTITAQPAQHRVQPPVYFEANHGRFDSEIVAAARAESYAAVFTAGGVVVAIPGQVARASIEFVDGARRAPDLTAPLDGRVNDLIGPEARWRRDVPTFGRVRYREVYPGIDVEFYATGGRLEYDFLLAAGADAGRIALTLSGDAPPRISAAGDLELPLGSGNSYNTDRPRTRKDHWSNDSVYMQFSGSARGARTS